MAIRFCRDSDWADLGNERIGSLGYVPAVRFDCLDATARTAGNTTPCGVINGTPHGFLFDTKKFLQAWVPVGRERWRIDWQKTARGR
jgi:hypothetical protein